MSHSSVYQEVRRERMRADVCVFKISSMEEYMLHLYMLETMCARVESVITICNSVYFIT